jgi:hypothetical protein
VGSGRLLDFLTCLSGHGGTVLASLLQSGTRLARNLDAASWRLVLNWDTFVGVHDLKGIPMSTVLQRSDVISSEDVEGTDVYNPAGDKLGSIDDLMIDKVSGNVRYAVMEFGGFLGMGTDRYPIPWGLLKYDTAKDGYVVPLDKGRLSSAPKYSRDETPTYTQEYGARVDQYYGPYL